jgi:hypothetical protein
MVTIAGANASCGTDNGPQLTVEVSIAADTKTYTDSLHACRMTSGAIYVDNIGAAFGAVSKFAHN